jgi:hypothetical protein
MGAAMKPRVLLSSVFKPFSVDSIYSRADSKIELYHNQITKYQGVFSMRSFMDSFGLHVIANNIDVPTTVLDFPTLPRFIREVKKGYDVIGISGIMPNFQKIKKMTETVREISPHSTLVVGGFCAGLPDINKMMDIDHVCLGEGIGFMRRLLGLPEPFTFKNPNVVSQMREVLGVPLRHADTPHIVVGLGCSYGCDFCSPSHFFGRRHIKFFKNGRDLFEEMVRVKRRFKTNIVSFIGDDNFLLDRQRAEELRECVIASGEIFNIFLFGSADKVIEFGPERLAEMGTALVWMGREGKFSSYAKNRGVNLKALLAELRSVGIKTILSSILLLDEHTKENIEEDIDEHLSCNPVFSQFAHYSPVPGTPLYDRLEKEGRILHQIPLEEWHAFRQPWFIHPSFSLVEAEKVQGRAYTRDFLELGPSSLRFIAVDHEGWRNLKDSDKPHLRKRAQAVAAQGWKLQSIALAIRRLAPTDHIRDLADNVLAGISRDFGPPGLVPQSIAAGLHLSGRVREWRTACFGDAIQPLTRLVKYNQ